MCSLIGSINDYLFAAWDFILCSIILQSAGLQGQDKWFSTQQRTDLLKSVHFGTGALPTLDSKGQQDRHNLLKYSLK